MSYISWYVLGGMSLTCLPIFAWQWGRKHNNTEKNEAFWVKPHFWQCLIFWQHGVFSFTKVCIFLPMVFIRTFMTTLCFYDFCKTVLVKKCTPCHWRCGLIFPFQMVYFLHWLFSSTLLTQLKPPEASEQAAKKSRALPSSSLRGLRAPDPANPSSEKMTSQSNCFAVCTSPKA